MRLILRILREITHRLLVAVGAVALTLVFFLVLPLMQSISKPPETDTLVRSVDAVLPPPPPPIEEEKPEEKPEEEPPPPQLTEEAPPLDLSQLEITLNPGGGNWGVGDFAVNLKTVVNAAESADALFSLSDLDQKPRVIYHPGPNFTAALRREAPGTVYILFIVDQNGRVQEPKIQSSTNPVFNQAALNAVKNWKFEPGKRNGEAVRFRMRVPITFPKG